MNRSDEILRVLGRIEGELKAQGVQISNGLAEIRALSERVRTIEFRHAWLGGAWAVLAAACAYLFRVGGRSAFLSDVLPSLTARLFRRIVVAPIQLAKHLVHRQ